LASSGMIDTNAGHNPHSAASRAATSPGIPFLSKSTGVTAAAPGTKPKVLRPRDHPRLAVRPAPVTTSPVRQIRPQGPRSSAAHLTQPAHPSLRAPPQRPAPRHHTPDPSSASRQPQPDPLGQRPARLREDGDQAPRSCPPQSQRQIDWRKTAVSLVITPATCGGCPGTSNILPGQPCTEVATVL
jgi:hypothetical protein